jgi:phosphate transport system protein
VSADHIVRSYDKELNLLTDAIVNMGSLVEDLIKLANKSLHSSHHNFVEQANKADIIINNYDLEIEQRAIQILALRQPMAIDLRQAISALKIAVIMERMGDLAKNTTMRGTRVKKEFSNELKGDIDQMVDLITSSLRDVILAFKNNNAQLASEIPSRDLVVDEIYTKLMEKIEVDLSNNPQNIKSNIQIIYAIKNLERIGDYVSKIARIIYYIITGNKNIRKK